MATTKNRRCILPGFISGDQCEELKFIYRSSCTVGYRPNVFSTTLSHLCATNCSHLIMPFVSIRENLKEKVEGIFGVEYELFFEFTGLIGWAKGAKIGWHCDNNRSYLKQRDFTAVCYLNNYGVDFCGGLLRFQDGEPRLVVPVAGVNYDVAIYSSDCCDTHSVDEVTEGERLTLTLWFTRDISHDEDAKLISLLSLPCPDPVKDFGVPPPLPGSSSMYWFSPDPGLNERSGFNICAARIHILGFDIVPSHGSLDTLDPDEQLMKPIKLAYRGELFEFEFANILHALQAVQFYCWMAPKMANCDSHVVHKAAHLTASQHTYAMTLKPMALRNPQEAESVFGFPGLDPWKEFSVVPEKFSAAVNTLEEYCSKLMDELKSNLPHWRSHNIIHIVNSY